MLTRMVLVALSIHLASSAPAGAVTLSDAKKKVGDAAKDLKDAANEIHLPQPPAPVAGLKDKLGSAVASGEHAVAAAKQSVDKEWARDNPLESIEARTRAISSAGTQIATAIHAEVQKIPFPEGIKALPSYGPALLDWAQIQGYIRALREFGPAAQKRSQEGQARYIRFLDEWLTKQDQPVNRAPDGDLKAAGVPLLPSGIDSDALDEQAKVGASLASPKYPWHSPPNGAGTHQFQGPNRLLASRADIREACVQHDKDFQSPGVSVEAANDKLEKELRRIYFEQYPEMRPLLQ